MRLSSFFEQRERKRVMPAQLYKNTKQPARELSVGTYHGAMLELGQWNLSADQLSRVSLDSDGTLQLETDAAHSIKWLSYIAGALRPVAPHDDRKIPCLYKKCNRVAPFPFDVVSYRPGRRVVLKSAVRSDQVISKGYRKGRAANAVRNHERAIKACERGGFGVPSLISYCEELDVLTMARRPGRAPVVNAGNSPMWRAIGSGLRRFQESCDITGLKTFGPDDELEVLDELARRFRLCELELPPHWEAGREKLGKLAEHLPESEFSAAHRDLHDGQFLAGDEGLNLLDFDLLCLADVALDPGNLVAHIVLRDLQSHGVSAFPDAQVCSHAFLSGLQRQDEAGFAQRCVFYQASTFYRLALVYALRPRWHHLVSALVRLGEHRLHEVTGYAF